jgi:hypothetical protein
MIKSITKKRSLSLARTHLDQGHQWVVQAHLLVEVVVQVVVPAEVGNITSFIYLENL